MIRVRHTVIRLLIALLVVSAGTSAFAQVSFDGFVQGLFGGRLDATNPVATEQPASETRLQLRMEDFGEGAEFFGRLDFVFDGADSVRYDWEVREAWMKFRLGSAFDIKVGRQILTWGTGDLIFINDVFAKDYLSFFVGRDDQYLKAPQNALRVEYYSPLGGLNLVWTPRFEPNRLPTGRRLSYYHPMAGDIVGTGTDPANLFRAQTPSADLDNGEFAARFNRYVGGFSVSVYFYRGFYKNPLGFDTTTGLPYYPRLNVYGASLRGALWGGVLWMEGGYLDSREDPEGTSPFVVNSSMTGLVGFERQVATNLTANLQWQVDRLLDYDSFAAQQPAGQFVRDEVRHLLTSRITKLLYEELVTLSAFAFWSPSDEDLYVRLYTEYKYTDELTLAVGANIFDGKHTNTDFGQFQKNDNVYLKLTYGF